MSFKKKLVIINLVAFFCFILDRALKWLFSQQHEFIVIKGWLEFGLFENMGIAFGLPFANWLFYLIVVVVLLILFYFLIKSYKNKKIFSLAVLTFVVVGAISNLIDRVNYGYVVDYIAFWQWSVFNLADAMIVIAVLVYFIRAFDKRQQEKLTG